MTTRQIKVSRWWIVPAALGTALLVGCSSVGGSAARDAATPTPSDPGVGPTSISVVAPADTEPSDTQPSDTQPSVVVPTTEPAAEETDPPSSENSDSSEVPSGPGGGTPGPTITSTDPLAPSTPSPSTSAGKSLELDRFQSPSRNIRCLIEEGLSVRCDLGESDITEEHDCGDGGDWGQAIGLDRGQVAEMLCASDTIADPDAPVLAYGSSAKVGSITCTSSQEGMACSDDLGHGFRLSRSDYEVR